MDQHHLIARRRDANLPSFFLDLALQRQRPGSKPLKIRGIEIENISRTDNKLPVARGNNFGEFRIGGKLKRLDVGAVLSVEHPDLKDEISGTAAGVARRQLGRSTRTIDLVDQDPLR